MDTISLQISGLTFGHGGSEPILQNIDLKCYSGRVYGLFGDNGSGKTTLFNLICGFLTYGPGQIYYYGELPPSKDPLSICSFRGGVTRTFQTPVLVDELSIHDNLRLAFREPDEKLSALMYSRHHLRELNLRREEKIQRWLKDFGLDGIRSTLAGALSFGRRRIVANLIALLHDSRIVLLDEPFTNLHATQVELLKNAIRREALEAGKCVIVIEHSPSHLASHFFDSLFFLRRTLRTYDFEGSGQAMRNKLHSFIYHDD
jgi:ABC-type branched-subunit amino acid transport system ATPase component